jgi:hypothetical protein
MESSTWGVRVKAEKVWHWTKEFLLTLQVKVLGYKSVFDFSQLSNFELF